MERSRGTAKSELACAAGAALGLGGAGTAAAVSACCAGPAVGPLVISLLGASGAVALEGLRPYTLALLVLSAFVIGASFRLRAHRVRWLLWLSVFVWLASFGAILWARADAGTSGFIALSSMDEPLRDAFNRQRDRVRVVELVSPTCPICLAGVSSVEHALFAEVPSKNLAGFVVWVPMLGGRAGNVPEAMSLAPDPRILHYWDESNDLGVSYERVLPVPGGPAWDVYMLYAPGIVWSGSAPPTPSFWMHQLPITNAPRLDAAVFAQRARALLALER